MHIDFSHGPSNDDSTKYEMCFRVTLGRNDAMMIARCIVEMFRQPIVGLATLGRSEDVKKLEEKTEGNEP